MKSGSGLDHRDDACVNLVREGSDDFLEYLGSIGFQLAHMARSRRHTFIAYLLGMVVSEVTRISGPLLDRIDLHLEVPAVSAADLILPPPAEGSAEVALRVAKARAWQVARYADLGLSQVTTNAAAPANVIEQVAAVDAGGMDFVRAMADQLRLSARGFHRVLKLARTLADLDGAKSVGRVQLAEALSYRPTSDRRTRAVA